MSYGLKIYDSSGNVVLDITDKITRYRYSTEAPSNTNGSVELSDISGIQSVEFSLKLDTTYNTCPHLVTRSGNTISWSHQSGDNYSSANSLIFIFLYT